MVEPIWQLAQPAGPLVAAAIDVSHPARDDVARKLALEEGARLREKGPFADANFTCAVTVAIKRNFKDLPFDRRDFDSGEIATL